MTVKVSTSDPAVAALLGEHASIEMVGSHDDSAFAILFQEDWTRRVFFGRPDVELAGLIETIDNNPLVCADSFSVPGPVSTLALIALEPLMRAGILVEDPVVQVMGAAEEDVDPWLARCGWGGEVAISFPDDDLGSIIAINAIAVVDGKATPDEISNLYRESFSRSLYVHECTDGDWDTKLVAGRPFAGYRLTVSECDQDEPTRLVTIRAMADRNGKCGAAQVVHAINVMCGFPESLGIPD